MRTRMQLGKWQNTTHTQQVTTWLQRSDTTLQHTKTWSITNKNDPQKKHRLEKYMHEVMVSRCVKVPNVKGAVRWNMSESSKFLKSWMVLNFQKNAVCIHKLKKPSSNAQLSFDKLIINQRSYHNLLKLAFWSDFLWSVSLIILNSGFWIHIYYMFYWK